MKDGNRGPTVCVCVCERKREGELAIKFTVASPLSRSLSLCVWSEKNE